jgi:poly(A) polymerase
MKFGSVEEMRTATLKKFVRFPHFEEHLALHRLDCLSSHRNLESYDFVRQFLEKTTPEQVRPVRLLGGDDLQTMGFRPGPLFAQILQSLEDAQLEGQIKTRQEAEEYVVEKFASRKGKD